MAANGITDVEANAILDARILSSDTVDLVTTMGTATAAPTKVTGGSYAAQTGTWAAAASREKHNSATVTFSGLPAATIVGIDTAATGAGARKWFIPFQTSGTLNPRTVLAGDSMIFAAAGISLSLANGT